MPVSIYRLTPGRLTRLLNHSENGAVCYTCGRPLKTKDIIVSNVAIASHRNFRHAKCAVLKGVIDESDLDEKLQYVD